MISRYCVECPGCESKILLRISVGRDLEQPFYYVCKKCNAATRGKQIIWYKPSPGNKIEIEDGKLLPYTEKTDQVISIHPDLPAIPDAKDMNELGGSPFLMHHQLLGNRLEEFLKRLGMFRDIIDSDWKAIHRLITYYLDRNWEQFDIQGKKLIDENWPSVKSEMQRHDILHRFLDILCAPLWIKSYYPEMKEDWNLTFNEAIKKRPKELELYLELVKESQELPELQRSLFHCLELYINNKSGLLPGLAVEMYQDGLNDKNRLRLFRDEFPLLRDVYISSFEACHKTLNYIIGVLNIVYRGNYNSFINGDPKNLNKFAKLPNARKAQFLSELPMWSKYWSVLLNRPIRNAIGHHSVRHDLPSGMLLLKGDEKLPYLEFVIMSLRLIHPILACCNAVKIFLIAFSIRNK